MFGASEQVFGDGQPDVAFVKRLGAGRVSLAAIGAVLG